MLKPSKRLWFICWFVAWLAIASMTASSATGANETQRINPLTYFEIPVTDMDRAVDFYIKVFGYRFERTTIDGYDMALFPSNDDAGGASGALAKGDVYVPSKTGVVIYFSVEDIDATLLRANNNGGATLYAKKSIGDLGYVAEIEDSEGNRIALHAAKK